MAILASITAAGRRNRRAVARRWASDMCRGKPGGALGMNLFSSEGLYDNTIEAEINAYHNARDPGGLPYALNPHLWCAELLPKLTCLAIHKDDCGTGEGAAGAAWRARYGGVAITKRHILGCAHGFSHAMGTWTYLATPEKLASNSPPTRIRFLDNAGVTVDRILLHHARADEHNGNSNAANAYGSDPADLHVGVLNADLPDSVYIPKVAPSNRLFELADYECVSLSQEWQPQSGVWMNWIYIDQVGYGARQPPPLSNGITVNQTFTGGGALSISVTGRTINIIGGALTTAAQVITAVNVHPAASLLVAASPNFLDTLSANKLAGSGSGTFLRTDTPPSDYPFGNRQMLWPFRSPDGGWGPYFVNPDFRFSAYSGDSGTPQLVKLKDELVVAAIVSAASSLEHVPPTRMSWPQRLNHLINEADAAAVRVGRLPAPTGYVVTPYAGHIL